MSANSFLTGLPLIGGLFDDSQDQAIAQVQKNQDLWSKLNTPDLQWQNYTPEQLAVAGKYNPEDASATQIKEDPSLKSDQLSALKKIAGLADTGMSAQDELDRNSLLSNAARNAKSSRDAAMNSAEARGVGGGGLEFALGEMGSQDALDQAKNAGLQKAAQTANQRALYNQAYMSGVGNLRDQDYRTDAANTGALNQFNLANTQAQNAAQQYNLNNAQNISNQNVANSNTAQQANNAGRISTAQQNYGNQVTRLNGQTGANTSMANAYGAENAANQANRNANTDLLLKVGSKASGAGTAPGAGGT